MALPYPNPSLSEMADDETRAGSLSNESQQTQPKDGPVATKMGRRQIALTIILCAGLMFSCLDTSIVSTALVSVSTEFQNYQDTPWVVLGYLLTYMSFAIGFARMSDLFGRKHVLVVAWVFFTLGSVWCGFSRHMGELIAGRAVQGIGGSGLYSLAQVCLLEQGPSRPEVVGALVGITLSISFVLGPLLGGSIAEWNWRGIFWFNIPFGVLAVLGVYVLWPKERHNRYGVTNSLLGMDYPGITLLATASVLLAFAMQQAGSYVWSWSSPVIICSLVVAFSCWTALGLWEYYLFRRRSERIQSIFPMRLITDRVYLLCLGITLLAGFCYIALVIKIPERLQIIDGDNSLWAGVHLLPMLGSCASGSYIGGVVSRKANRTSQTLVVGSALQVVGLGLIFGCTSSLNLGLLMGLTTIYGLGVGMSFAACTMIAAIEAHNHELASAQGTVAQARVLGGALGLAICTIVFNNNLQSALGPGSGSPLGESDLDQLHRSPVAVMGLSEDVRKAVIDVYQTSFREQTMIMFVIAAVAMMMSLGTYKSRPNDVVGTMMQHKEFAGRGGVRGDVELSSISSERCLI